MSTVIIKKPPVFKGDFQTEIFEGLVGLRVNLVGIPKIYFAEAEDFTGLNKIRETYFFVTINSLISACRLDGRESMVGILTNLSHTWRSHGHDVMALPKEICEPCTGNAEIYK